MWGRLLSPFWKLRWKGRNKIEEEAERIMVSTISFIQANLQHSIAASGVLTRTVGVKGIDMALVQEQRGLHQEPQYSRIHPLLCGREEKT